MYIWYTFIELMYTLDALFHYFLFLHFSYTFSTLFDIFGMTCFDIAKCVVNVYQNVYQKCTKMHSKSVVKV